MENCILVDWLTYTNKESDLQETKNFLGLDSCKWIAGKGSKLHYEFTEILEGITIHYTISDLPKYNAGVCVEMTGTGCRTFETHTTLSKYTENTEHSNFDFLFNQLSEMILDDAVNVTRVDLAYDDFIGVIDLPLMEDFTRRGWYTSRLSRWALESSGDNHDTDHLGVNIYHGSRGGNVQFRCYDKRVERKRYDLEHWVRFEIQMRHEAAVNYIKKFFAGEKRKYYRKWECEKLGIDYLEHLKSNGIPLESEENDVFCNSGKLGFLFSSIVKQYIDYKCPGNDKIKCRWCTAPWWFRFLGECEKISLFSRRDSEYNRERMQKYAYKQNKNHTKTLIEVDGLGEYLLHLHDQREEIPQKYIGVAAASENSDEILRRLAALPHESSRDYLQRCQASISSALVRLDQEEKAAAEEQAAALAAELAREDLRKQRREDYERFKTFLSVGGMLTDEETHYFRLLSQLFEHPGDRIE